MSFGKGSGTGDRKFKWNSHVLEKKADENLSLARGLDKINRVLGKVDDVEHKAMPYRIDISETRNGGQVMYRDILTGEKSPEVPARVEQMLKLGIQCVWTMWSGGDIDEVFEKCGIPAPRPAERKRIRDGLTDAERARGLAPKRPREDPDVCRAEVRGYYGEAVAKKAKRSLYEPDWEIFATGRLHTTAVGLQICLKTIP